MVKTLEHLYPDLMMPGDYEVRNDGSGQALFWKTTDHAQPTEEQLTAAWKEFQVKQSAVISPKEFFNRFTAEETTVVMQQLPALAASVFTAATIDLLDETSQAAQLALAQLVDDEETRIFTDERIAAIFSTE